MERLDNYEVLPSGMKDYLSSYGHHISKNMYHWAVSMMRDKKGNHANASTKDEVMDLMKSYGVVINNAASYDVPYVYMMAKMDYLGSSIKDESSLLLYVKDYCDDVDGNPTRAFDELYVNLLAKGVGIDWEDML